MNVSLAKGPWSLFIFLGVCGKKLIANPAVAKDFLQKLQNYIDGGFISSANHNDGETNTYYKLLSKKTFTAALEATVL